LETGCRRSSSLWFIKTRTIQDCLAWAFEYIYQCQQSKQEIVIIKLDFTKGFDTVEHSTIIQMMKEFGFNEPWLQWTENILSTATTSVLLNEVPGKQLAYKRGIRQGDPMSLMLFVMAAELLQCIINKAHHMGLIQMPIPPRGTTDFPIIQYADDTILIMQASHKNYYVSRQFWRRLHNLLGCESIMLSLVWCPWT
jgi:hypothetical protein